MAWLYRIATNLCLDRLRRRQPSTVPLDTEAASKEETGEARGWERPASEVQTAPERSEMSECVQKYLDTLPGDYRTVIFLHDVFDLSNPETAQLLDCSVATAKIRLHRARVRLRGVLNAACTFEIDERGVMVCDPVPQTTCEGQVSRSCCDGSTSSTCRPRSEK
jgi:RNA polymerase sigma-70 factor, ECF subfamily